MMNRAARQPGTPVEAVPLSAEPFRRERLIRFSDCDPAAIVFYPQYFVMFNALVEDWFTDEADGLGIGYRALVVERRIGLPTVHLEADFTAVSRMGDAVALTLDVERLGSHSLTLKLRCTGVGSGEPRMAMRQVLVATSLETHRAIQIPPDLRAAIVRRNVMAHDTAHNADSEAGGDTDNHADR